MAKKKGTTDKRYAVDYRGLNQELIGNVIGVPRIDDLLETWSQSKWWSTFDLAAAFWSTPMREEDKKFTAFHAYCDGGFQQYQFRVMPFGLKPASSLFQAAFQRVMANLPFCRVYIGDGVCATDTDSFGDHALAASRTLFREVRGQQYDTENVQKSMGNERTAYSRSCH